MRHSYTMRLHGVSRNIGVVTDIGIVKICDLLWLRRSAGINVDSASWACHVVSVHHVCGGCAQLRDYLVVIEMLSKL